MLKAFKKEVSILDLYMGVTDGKEAERSDRESRVKVEWNCAFLQSCERSC